MSFGHSWKKKSKMAEEKRVELYFVGKQAYMLIYMIKQHCHPHEIRVLGIFNHILYFLNHGSKDSKMIISAAPQLLTLDTFFTHLHHSSS